MAIINSMGVGKSKGSMGNVTYTTDAAGRTIGRQKPVEVSNPQSDAQTAQRDNFTVIVSFMSGILNVLNSFWKRTKANVAPYSEAVGKNLKTIGKDLLTLVEIAAIRMQVTKGTLQGLVNQRIGTNTYNDTTFEWDFRYNWDVTLFGNASSSDIVQLILFNLTKGQQEAVTSTAIRSEDHIVDTFTLTYPSDVYVIFATTQNTAGTLWGDNYTLAYYNGSDTVAPTA
jgi:Family of unknown function (DUF6266)